MGWETVVQRAERATSKVQRVVWKAWVRRDERGSDHDFLLCQLEPEGPWLVLAVSAQAQTLTTHAHMPSRYIGPEARLGKLSAQATAMHGLSAC